MSLTQGTLANLNGRRFEDKISTYLTSQEVKHQREITYIGLIPSNTLRNRYDFKFEVNGKTIGLEAKSQNSTGSVAQKIPYVMEDGYANIVCDIFIALIEGVGFPLATLPWAKERAKLLSSDKKQLYAFNFEEFEQWLKNEQSESEGITKSL